MSASGQGPQLAVIEVGAKQRWIFDTNRLRDAVGASYLVTSVVDFATREAGKHVQLAASGAVRAVFPDRAAAVGWIGAVTRHFAREAPGMEVTGATVLAEGGSDAALDAVFQRLDQNRRGLGGTALQDRTLPWLMPCHYSGMPAVDQRNPVGPEHDQGRRVGAAVLARRRAFGAAQARIHQELVKREWSHDLILRIDDAVSLLHDGSAEEPLSDSETWRGVIHADGNGLGRIFLHFAEVARKAGVVKEEARLGLLQEFSRAVDDASWDALRDTLAALYKVARPDPRRPFPVYPLVVGGDDLTVVLDGRYALFFADRYLRAFEHHTARGPIPRVLAAAREVFKDPQLPVDSLRACAGVALVKHHFPFSVAYDLAEKLCTSAKKAFKPGRSGLDWHAVLDASPPELDVIRSRLAVRGGEGAALLTRRPYDLQGFSALARGAAQLQARDEDGRFAIPRAQLHEVRDGLFRGVNEGAYRYDAAVGRVGPPLRRAVADLHGTEADTLFVNGSTGFLDAVDHLGLFEGLLKEAP